MTACFVYPLDWPDDRRRTERREWSSFQLSLSQARIHLQDELRRFGATEVVISTNMRVSRSGVIVADQKQPQDPGVVARFQRKGMDITLPCDRWMSVRENLRAIGRTIENLRANERYGTTWMVDATLQGFAALPAGTGAQDWWDVLGLAPDAERWQIDIAYRDLAKVYHPDVVGTGDAERFRRITEAFEQARRNVAV